MSAHAPRRPRSLFSRLRSRARKDGAPVLPAATQPAGADALPVWAMVASVIDTGPADGAERPEDLKDFAPGAMVYVLGPAGPEAVSVIGRGRKGARLVGATMLTEHLTGWRVEPVYSPSVLRRLGQGGQQCWPVHALDLSGDGYRLELLGLAAGFARRGRWTSHERGEEQRGGG